MGIFARLFRTVRRQNSQTLASGPLSQSLVPQQPTPPPSKPLSITELERQMAAEAQALQAYSRQTKRASSRKGRVLAKLTWTALLIGVPLGTLWVLNLPYPMIRWPVAKTAPILLLPSYIQMDQSYRQAIALVEEANQLIANPTSFEDLELGEQKLQQAQEHLNALPIGFLQDFPQYRYGWYNWRFSQSQFNASRARVGELQAKVFQEKNAQNALFEAEQTLKAAEQQYQQATTSVDKQQAITAWRSALDQLAQIPGQTLAGRMAQQKLVAYERNFQEIVGLAAGNAQASNLIATARRFAWEAAQAGQNPPHSVEEWQRVEGLWQEAISWLERIPPTDLAANAEAQKMLVRYKTDLGITQVQLQAEEEAVRVFQIAQRDIQSLQAIASDSDGPVNRGLMISRLQGIIDQLKQVKNGTTVYPEAQQLLLSAQNKLQQIQ